MKQLFIALVRGYQLCISPLFPPSCRFSPTCSQYAIEAISLHGATYGLYLAIRRILRCHPFHPGGFDPVDRSSRGGPIASLPRTPKKFDSDKD